MHSNLVELMRLVSASFKQTPVRDTRIPTSDDCSKLFFEGFFLSLAIGGAKGGHIVASSGERATLHPSSVVEALPRQLVAFHELMRTSKDWIRTAVVAQFSWLDELLTAHVASSAVIAQLRSDCEQNLHRSEAIGPLTASLMTAVLGHRFARRRTIEQTARGSLTVDVASGIMTLTCRQPVFDTGLSYVNSLIAAARADVANETHERIVAGATRVVFGASAVVKVIVNSSLANVHSIYNLRLDSVSY